MSESQNNKIEWKDVSVLYNNFINNRDNGEIQNLFFNTAIKYVIQNPNCIICQKPEFCTELMFCFSCPPKEILIEFRKALELQLRNCANCIEKYHDILLPEFYKTSLPTYGKTGLDKFISDMIEWDVKRISTHLEIIINGLFESVNDVVKWKKIRSQSVFPLYEIFKYPIVLKSWDVESKFITLLKHLLEKRTKLTLFNNIIPGFLILALNNSEFIRNWATNIITKFPEPYPLSQAIELKSYFEDIVFYLENGLPSDSFKQLENGKLNKYYHYTEDIDTFLHGFCSIINVIHPEILLKFPDISTKLFKLITLLFKHWKGIDVLFFFNTIEIFFKTLKKNIWNSQYTNSSEIILILKQILNNEQYKKILTSNEIFSSLPDKSTYLNWLFYFSQSAECVYPLVSVELWKYTIEQSNEWCEEAKNYYKLLIYDTVQHLSKVEIVDLLLLYCLKEMKESEYKTKLFEIAKNIIKEDTNVLINNHNSICELDQSKSHDKNDDDFTKLISSNNDKNKIEIKSLHLLTWRYICSFDILKGNKDMFDTLLDCIIELSFIFSDRHNYNIYEDNLVNIRRYVTLLLEVLSDQTMDTLKGYFSDERKISVLVHLLFSCDNALSQISIKLLDKILVKNIDDEIYEPVVLVFSEYPEMCIKLISDKLNKFNVLSKDKDIFCMLHFAIPISSVIEKLIPNIGKISKNYETKNSLEAAIFNFLYQVINRCRQWIKVKPDESLLISKILHNSLDIISEIVKSIKNQGAECEFSDFKNDLVHFISPLSKQLIYENGRIYFDKIFNLMINILSFIEPPNKLDEKYLNILKKIYEYNELLPVHKEKLFEIIKHCSNDDSISNDNNKSNNANSFGIPYSMISPNQVPTTLPNGIHQVPYNVALYPQQQLNQMDFLNRNSLLGINSQNYGIQYQNNPMFPMQNNDLQKSMLKQQQQQQQQQQQLNDSKDQDSSESIKSIKSTEDNKNESEDIIILDDDDVKVKNKSDGSISLSRSVSNDSIKENNEEKLNLKRIQEDMKKSILSSYKYQSKITDMKPLSSSSVKSPFNIEPKKVSVQKSIKSFSTNQSTDALLNIKPVSSNPVHKMSSNVFNPPSPPPFTNKYLNSGLKQPKSSIQIKSPKHPSSGGGKLSKLQSLRKDFNLQRDQIQNRRVPIGQLSKHTHSNPNFDNDSKLKEESEESSSSEDEGSEGILDLLNDYSQNLEPVVKEKRTIKMLDDTPIIIGRKKKIIANSIVSGVIKKKSSIDIRTLHRHVLSWNYFMKGDRPPNIGSLQYIPESFESYEDYVKVFEPLILTECWAQFQKSKEDIDIDNDIIKIILEDRCSVDDFEEIKFSATTNDIRSKGFTENDILYLRSDDEKSEKENINNSKDSKSNSKYSFFVLISNINNKKNEAILNCRAYLRNSNSYLISSLRKTSSWKTTKVFTCVTCNREYLAMKYMENSNLLNNILKPKNQESNKKIIESRYVANLMEKYKLNESQAQSICGSVKSKEGFTLIQGPPGTGKTKTILSLISELKEKALPKKVKILVCAPSNAGCDEIVRRLKRGVQKSDGQIYKPKLVRIGTEAIHPDCKDVTLDALVDDLFSNDMVNQSKISKSDQNESILRKQLEEIHTSLDELRKKEQDVIVNKHDDVLQQEISLKIGELIRKRKEVRVSLESTQVKNRQILDQAKQQTKKKVLNDADVVLSTLSGSGHDILLNIEGGFEIVIVDEAAQAVELSSLIPIKYGATKVILVGDPNQLPPTVISLLAQKYSYEQSLFKRLQMNNPDSVYLLNVQYRMHPHISSFPSKHFYNSKIVNSMNMEKLRYQPWHEDKRFRPYQIINVEGKEAPFGTSLINQSEVDSIIILVRSLCDMNQKINFATRIGIITPYNGQSTLLKRKFNSVFGSKILHYIDINTIDGFQGQEKDIIIFSCVRAHPKSNSIGFLADIRRMNVGITRARNSLFIVGHLHSLMKNDEWKSLIEDGKKRNAIRDFTKCNYEYNRDKIPLNIYASALIGDNKSQEIENNKPIPLKRSLKDKTIDKPIIKKGRMEAIKEKLNNKNDKDELDNNKKVSEFNSKKNNESNNNDGDSSSSKTNERDNKKLKIDTSSSIKPPEVSSENDISSTKIKSPSLKERYKEKVAERENREQRELQKENKDSRIGSPTIRSPSLKERYKEKVEEREQQQQKENKNSKNDSSGKIRSPTILKDRYKDKIDEHENKKQKIENSSRVKSPDRISNDYKENIEKDNKSRSHHSHHHRHHHSSSHSSSYSSRSSSISLNNDVYDPVKLNGNKEKKKVKKHVEFLDQLVTSIKTTEQIARENKYKYPMNSIKRH